MRYLIKYSFLLLLFIGKPVATCSQQAYSLTLDELFRLGTENSLRLQASHMQEVVAADKKNSANGPSARYQYRCDDRIYRTVYRLPAGTDATGSSRPARLVT